MSEVFYNAKNLTVSNGFVRNPDRYYLEEYFKRRPAANVDIADNSGSASQTLAHNIANKDFELAGAGTPTISFSTTDAGLQLQTGGSDNNQAIVLPHLDPNQTAWSGIKWGTENQVEWECAIRTGGSGHIANMSFWAGLKVDNTPNYTTNDDQAYFLYATDDGASGTTLPTVANLHFVYSIGGTDYVTDLGIVVEISTIYKLRISIDKNRQVAVYVNGVQYGLTTSDSVTTQSNSNTLSKALTNTVDLIPYVGVQALTGSAKQITLCYEKISRVL